MATMARLIAAFVMIIVGVSLISVIATQEQAVTTKTLVTSERLSIANTVGALGVIGAVNGSNVANAYDPNADAWKIADSTCDISVITVANSTKTFTVTTDYTAATNGTLVFKNSNNVNNSGNITFITYTYCADDYMSQAWSRTVLNLVAGFFALALMAIGIGLFYGIGKETGIF